MGRQQAHQVAPQHPLSAEVPLRGLPLMAPRALGQLPPMSPRQQLAHRPAHLLAPLVVGYLVGGDVVARRVDGERMRCQGPRHGGLASSQWMAGAETGGAGGAGAGGGDERPGRQLLVLLRRLQEGVLVQRRQLVAVQERL